MHHQLGVGTTEDLLLLFVLDGELVEVHEQAQHGAKVVRVVSLRVTVEDRLEELEVVENLRE